MRRKLLVAWFALAAVACTARHAAAEIAVFAEVRPPSVTTGEPFQLEVRVRSTGLGNGGDLVAPIPAGLQQVGHGRRTSLSLVNGRASQEAIDTFTLVAAKPGRYTFPGIGVRSGKSFTPAPVVSVNVTGPQAPPPAAQAPPAAGDNLDLPPEDADVYVTASVDKDHVRVGEPLVYTFRFYFRVNPESPTYDAPDFSGFQTYDLGQSKQPETILAHGRSYDYFDLKTLLYPLRAGKLTIGPASLTFRTSFFFTRENRRRTQPIEVMVDPLPEGAPASFHGAVGSFRLRMSEVPQTVAANEPVTLQLTVSGNGNFSAIGAPEAVSTGAWRIYPGRVSDGTRPTVAGLQGEKVFEVLMQPPGSGAQRPPAFRLTYFDSAEATYRSLVTQPPVLTIRGDGAVAAVKKAAPPLSLRPVRSELGEPPANPLRPWRVLVWLLPVPFLGLVLLSAGAAVNRRMRTVTPADKRLAADRRWERQLAEKDSDPRALLRALDQWLQETHGLSASPTEEEIRHALGSRADALLHHRRRLEGAVFGGARVDVRALQQGIREWMRKSKLVLLAAALIGGYAVHATAETPAPGRALFEQAQAAQIKGEFGEAVRLYKRVAEHQGVTVNLLYNLAGAAWRAGDAGVARYAIETAFAHDRRDADVAANRRLIASAIAAVGGSEEPAAPGKISLAETGWLAVVFWSLFSAAVLLGWFLPPARWGAAVFVVLSLPVWGYAFYLYQVEEAEQPGVLWTATPLREAASESSAQISQLPAGEIARVVEERDGFVRVSTPSGISGWIPSGNLRPLHLLDPRAVVPD